MNSNERHWNAFISYAHADVKMPEQAWTQWVRDHLTTYRTPEEFVGLTGVFHEPVPAAMPNVFLDHTEMGKAGLLTPELEEHLKRSSVLIVLCSPRFALSEYTAREVAYFKRQGRERGWKDADTAKRIIVLVLEGKPYGGPGQECFPPPLAYELSADGTPDTTRPAHPLYIDLRPHGAKGESTTQRGTTSLEAYERALRAESIYNEDAISKMVRAYEDQLFEARIMLLSSVLGLNHSELSRREMLRIKEEAARREAEAAEKIKDARRLTVIVAALALLFLVLSGCLAYYMNEARQAQALAKEKQQQAEQQAEVAQAATSKAEAARSEAVAAAKSEKEAKDKAQQSAREAEAAKNTALAAQQQAEAAAKSEKESKNRADALLNDLLNKCLWHTKESDATAKAITVILVSHYTKNPPQGADLEDSGRHAQLLLRQGDLEIDLKGEIPSSPEQLKTAEESYLRALETFDRILASAKPPPPWAHFNVGNTSGRLAAVARLKAANQKETPEARAALLLESVKHIDAAHYHFTEEIAASPTSSGIYWDRCVISREKAMLFRQLAQLPGQDTKKYSAQSATILRQAKSELEEMITLFPNDPEKAKWESTKTALEKDAQDSDAAAR